MKLEYHVLWFDDQEQAIRPFVDRVQSIITRLGFEPKIDLRIITADIENPLVSIPSVQDVDLVLMDWKLGGTHDGAVIARRLRQSYRDTDIVFYSSESSAKLRQLIFEQGIDGVFCANRTGLSDRAGGIVNAQLRRVLDLNHMRGIVMAATSDLDLAMIDILHVLQRILHPGDGAAGFAANIAERVSRSLSKKADEVAGFGRKGRLDKLLREPAFGSSLRLEILLEEMAKLADRIGEPHLVERLGQYKDDVIGPRNDFAHRKAQIINGKLVLEGREAPLDQEAMKALRLRLLDHSDNLRSLFSLLGEIAEATCAVELKDDIAAIDNLVAEAVEAVTSKGA